MNSLKPSCLNCVDGGEFLEIKEKSSQDVVSLLLVPSESLLVIECCCYSVVVPTGEAWKINMALKISKTWKQVVGTAMWKSRGLANVSCEKGLKEMWWVFLVWRKERFTGLLCANR